MNYKLTGYDKKYKKQILCLADSTLGEKYVSSGELDLLENSNSKKCLLLIDSNTDTLAGFCFYDLANFEITQQITKNLLDNSLQNETFGYVKTIAISPKYQGQKLGIYIMGECVKALKGQNITKLFTSIWDKPQNKSNVNMVMHYGLKVAVTIPDYWLDESITENYDCPICGKPCHCNCIIMTNFDVNGKL